MRISKREREAAIKWCNMRACWWFNGQHGIMEMGDHFENRGECLAFKAFEELPCSYESDDEVGETWLETEVILRDGWSPK